MSGTRTEATKDIFAKLTPAQQREYIYTLARGGDKETVEETISDAEQNDTAGIQVNKFWEQAFIGYLKGGFETYASDVLGRNKIGQLFAIRKYAERGKHAEVQNLIHNAPAEHEELYRSCAKTGYRAGRHYTFYADMKAAKPREEVSAGYKPR